MSPAQIAWLQSELRRAAFVSARRRAEASVVHDDECLFAMARAQIDVDDLVHAASWLTQSCHAEGADAARDRFGELAAASRFLADAQRHDPYPQLRRRLGSHLGVRWDNRGRGLWVGVAAAAAESCRVAAWGEAGWLEAADCTALPRTLALVAASSLPLRFVRFHADGEPQADTLDALARRVARAGFAKHPLAVIVESVASSSLPWLRILSAGRVVDPALREPG